MNEDAVHHPAHYTSHPSGVEAITLTETLTFNAGNALKYLFRRGSKSNELQDLEKSRWYVLREIERLRAEASDLERLNRLARRVFEHEPDDVARAMACIWYSTQVDDIAGLVEASVYLDREIARFQQETKVTP